MGPIYRVPANISNIFLLSLNNLEVFDKRPTLLQGVLWVCRWSILECRLTFFGTEIVPALTQQPLRRTKDNHKCYTRW